jgi:hypothetical protein
MRDELKVPQKAPQAEAGVEQRRSTTPAADLGELSIEGAAMGPTAFALDGSALATPSSTSSFSAWT